MKKKVLMFEIDLTRRLDSHNISTTVIPCVVDCIKKHIGEKNGSVIVENIKPGRTKAECILKNGISKTFLEETILKLQECERRRC